MSYAHMIAGILGTIISAGLMILGAYIHKRAGRKLPPAPPGAPVRHEKPVEPPIDEDKYEEEDEAFDALVRDLDEPVDDVYADPESFGAELRNQLEEYRKANQGEDV